MCPRTPRQASGFFFAAFNLELHRVFTSDIASGNIQCAYSVKENSFRGLLLTPRAKAIPLNNLRILFGTAETQRLNLFRARVVQHDSACRT